MTSDKVIRNYLIIAGLYTLSASLIWGVNTLFLLDAGLDIFEVFIANAVFTAGMALFEIPTGVLADTRGRRASFLLSVVTLAIGTIGYVSVARFGGGLLWFSLMSVVLGLGFTFYSGAVEAWLVDALNSTGFDGQLDGVFARGGLVTGAAMLVGTVGGGLLGDVDLALPFVVRAVLLGLLFFAAYLGMHDIGYQPRALEWRLIPEEMRLVAKDSLKFGWKNPNMRLIMVMGLVQGSFFVWAWYAWQPYLLELLGRDAVWVAGVVAALISLSMMAGNSLVEYLTRFCGQRSTLMLWASGVWTAAMILLGVVHSFWVALVLLLIAMVAFGVNQPVRQAFIHRSIPSEQRATIVSFDSMLTSLGGIGGQSGLGYLAQVRSIGSGYVTGGLVTGLALPVLFALRRRRAPADSFAGQAAGQDGASAVQGLPPVAAVDSAASPPLPPPD